MWGVTCNFFQDELIKFFMKYFEFLERILPVFTYGCFTIPYMHCIKYRYFIQFPGVGIFPTEFQVNWQNSTEIVRVYKISILENYMKFQYFTQWCMHFIESLLHIVACLLHLLNTCFKEQFIIKGVILLHPSHADWYCSWDDSTFYHKCLV